MMGGVSARVGSLPLHRPVPVPGAVYVKANEPNSTLTVADPAWPGWTPLMADVDDDDLEQAQRGLRQYVAEVATGMGVGVASTWCELADQGSAYLALDQRLPGRADRDVAL